MESPRPARTRSGRFSRIPRGVHDRRNDRERGPRSDGQRDRCHPIASIPRRAGYRTQHDRIGGRSHARLGHDEFGRFDLSRSR